MAYGTRIEDARDAIVQALEKDAKRDKYGRPVVDRERGISVVLSGFGDSSLDLSVKLFVLVSHRAAYMAKAKEQIYEALGQAGIEIPFPQRDVHIITE